MLHHTHPRRSRPKFKYNISAFLDENDVSYYLLGAFMTDGNIYLGNGFNSINRAKIAAKDEDWMSDIRNVVCPGKAIYQDKKYNCFHFELYNIDIVNWLISYGCIPNKSKILTIEKDIPTIYHRDFIRGAVDGDGSISICKYKKYKNGKTYEYTKITVYICGASLKFLEQIKEMIPSEINCSILTFDKDKINSRKHDMNKRKIVATCNIYRLCFNDSNAKKFLSWIYYPEHKISLSRKRNKTDKILER